METLAWETNKTSVQCLIIHESISLASSVQSKGKETQEQAEKFQHEGEWNSSLSVEHCSLTADSEGKKILWQVLWAVRAVDELCCWITSCQMLEACQLTVCHEKVDSY